MKHQRWTALDDFLPCLAQSMQPRSKGLHVSQLYTVLHPSPSSSFTEADLALFAIGGFAVEHVLERGLAAMFEERGLGAVVRPGEIVSSEGIICSPDLYFHEDGELIIGDIKAKWMSTKDFPMEPGENEMPPRIEKNLTQLQSYLHVQSELDQRAYTRGRLIIYFVNGNWRPPKPALLGWDLEWTVQEIEETWAALVQIGAEYDLRA